MTVGISTLAWLVISPVAVLTDILAVTILCHYRSQFHGSDVLYLSLSVSMAINAIVTVPLPAILKITDTDWTKELCEFYVWVFITSRLSQLFTLVFLVFHWVGILKISANKSDINCTSIVKVSVPLLWLVSGVIGLLPIIGAVKDEFLRNKSCSFLAFNLSRGFAIFFGIFILMCLFICIMCEMDVIIILKKMKNIALMKYGAGRFYLPRKRNGVAGGYTVHERYSQLNFAWDICRLTTCVVCISFSVNHLPYAVIQFMQIFGNTDKDTLEEISLWLILIEALIVPHLFWSLSRRYRHALCYLWKVVILRHARDEEEDPDLCTLQSFTRRLNEYPGSRNISRAESVNETHEKNHSHSGTLRNGLSTVTIPRPSGSETQQTGSVQSNSSHVTDGGYVFNMVTVDNKDYEDSPVSISKKDVHFLDLKRTASGSSRKEWKDQMRKKHLPTIFINEAFDGSDAKIQSSPSNCNSVEMNNGDITDTTSLHFYMSGNYHPDYLNTDSLPRKPKTAMHKSQDSFSSDSIIYQGKMEESYTDFNSLPRNIQRSIDSSSNSNLGRKKPPKMGIKSKESSLGSSNSLNKSHSSDATLNYRVNYTTTSEENRAQFNGSPRNIRALQPGIINQGRQDSERSESEGVSGQYEELDITNILDKSSKKSSIPVSKIKRDETGIENDMNTVHHKTGSESTVENFGSRFPDKFLSVSKNSDNTTQEEAVGDELKDYTANSLSFNVHNRTGSLSLENANSNTKYNSLVHPLKDIHSKDNTSIKCEYYIADYTPPPNTGHNTDSNNSHLISSAEFGNTVSNDRGCLYQSSNDTYHWSGEGLPDDFSVSSFSQDNQNLDTSDSFALNQTSNYYLSVDPDSLPERCSVSPRFDEQIDRGFEEALNVSYASRESLYSGSVTNFESVSESTDQVDVFDEQNSINEETFITQAVVSSAVFESTNSVDSNDRFDNSFTPTQENISNFNHLSHEGPTYSNEESADSGFNSGIEAPVNRAKLMSPWPENFDNVKSSEFTFETDFTSHRQTPDGSQDNDDDMPEEGSTFRCDVKPAYF